MALKKLVIVESPTKAKTISRFLDSSYMVESCMGHIRDLPESSKSIPEKYKKAPWRSLGVNTEKDFEPIYCVPDSKTKIVTQLKKKLKQASELILATDEDREGESISWHLQELLKPKVPVKRMVFHEITKDAIQSALKNFRKIDKNLVQAQETRRVLDRLVGYTLSPLLWEKIARGLSAGRVQSMAVKLISEKEMERFLFVKSSYWSIQGDFTAKDQPFVAQLLSYKSQKIAEGKDFDNKGQLTAKNKLHLTEKQAKEIEKELKTLTWKVEKVDKKPIYRQPKPPFITSTLQQAANRQLNLSSRQTMSVAQKLYEKGWITYMRTDSTSLSQEAIRGIRKTISKIYGDSYLHKSPRMYSKKSKGAQEAHEAIRPAGKTFTPPEKIQLSGEELRLYTLIWKRALASQMKDCHQEQTTVKVTSSQATFTTSGTVTLFLGFQKAYKDQESSASSPLLPPLKQGEKITCKKIEAQSHKTKPPARYNEASLIQKLEKEGIGRPSTYAPIISTVQDRGYIKKSNKFLAPTFTALAVTNLLSEHLPEYVDLNFTSDMEETLDQIALGKVNSTKYLTTIYKSKKGLEPLVAKQKKVIDGKESRTLIFNPFKNITFHVGRFGTYIIQKKNKKELKASIPDDLFLSDLTVSKLEEILETKNQAPKSIGQCPKTKKKIFMKTGRFGPYLELDGGEKRSSIPRFIPTDELSEEQAIALIDLPTTLGNHPETKKPVSKSIGRFGPYVVHDGNFRSLPQDKSFFDITLKEALKALSQAKNSRSKASQTIKELKHDKSVIKIIKGRFGPYIKHKDKNYKLPPKAQPETLDLKAVLEIIQTSSPTSKKARYSKRKSKK